MGNLEYIDHLEAYVDELGNEITRVKKASEYLKLIEELQSEIKQASSMLNQSKDQLKLYQEIMESKLELFQVTAKNIEAKQQSLEQTQLNIIASLSELKQHQDKHAKEFMSALNDINLMVKLNHEALNEEFNHVKDQQVEHNFNLESISKTNKTYFTINAGLVISAAGIIVYLLVR